MSRQKKFLDIYNQTKDAAAAANETWPELPPRRRVRMAKYTMSQPEVSKGLEKYGLGMSKLMKKHQNLLSAKKTVCTNGLFEEVDNAEVQARMVELGYKMHGLLRSNSPEENSATVNINVDPVRLAEVAKRLEEINSKMLPPRPTQTIDVVDGTDF